MITLRAGYHDFRLHDLSERPIILIPSNLYDHERPDGEKRRIFTFEQAEMLLEHRVVHRIEFREKHCNLTLKNVTAIRQAVNVHVWVLNKSLIEIWHQTEKWSLTSLQPDQVHVVSWEFKPSVPDVVWNEDARSESPTWVIVDAL